MIINLIKANLRNLMRKILDCFKHDFVNMGPLPHTRVYKEDILSYILATWMGIEPMPTWLKGWSLTTRPGEG